MSRPKQLKFPVIMEVVNNHKTAIKTACRLVDHQWEEWDDKHDFYRRKCLVCGKKQYWDSDYTHEGGQWKNGSIKGWGKY